MSSEFPIEFRVSPRARRLRLRVDPRSGAVLLTAPRRTSERQALAWASSHRDWILARLAEIPPVQSIGPGQPVPLRGQDCLIDWAPTRPRKVERVGDRLLVGGPIETVEKRIVRWLKEEALAVLTAETRDFADRCGTSFSRVGIGDPVSRWGSCSSSGTIRYSWRLILAPDFVRRATVAHEVAHLIHLNHGPLFHRLVETLLEADPRPARSWLRREGAALHRFGRQG